MSSLLILNTDNSYTNEPHNAGFNLSNYSESNFFSKIALKSVTLPNLVYPVNSNNNSVVFEEDGSATDFTATLTPGAYSASELATEVKTRMDAAGANTYTVTYDTNTYKYVITTSGTSLRFTSDTTASKVIGVDTSVTTFAASVTSAYPLRLDGSQYLDLIVSLPSSNITSDNKPIFQRIPLTASFGEVLFWQAYTLIPIPFRAQNVISLDIRLLDDAGNSFEMPANSSIQYTFMLYN
jgi:hypothetical protein